jgi:hypothetical protein
MVSLSGPLGNEYLLNAPELLTKQQKTVTIARNISKALRPGEG